MKLPRRMAMIIWAIGALFLLGGELLAVWNAVPGDTISEVVWMLMGIGEPTTPVNLLVRIGVIGFFGWLLFHFTTKEV